MRASALRAITNVTLSDPVSTQSYPRMDQALESGPAIRWEIEAQRRLIRLIDLPDGWDGYDAVPVRHDAAMFALTVLSSVMRPRTPMPQIVPTADGGVQLEWHEKGIDLELYVPEPYRCEVWFEDRAAHNQLGPIEEELSNDFSILKEPVKELGSR